MKRADWGRVKRGQYLIYADPEVGVFKAKVTEIDLRLYEPGEPSRYGYPYGLTAETGAMKISYVQDKVTQEMIHNLGELIVWGPEKFRQLTELWDALAKYRALVDASKEEFNAQVLAWKEL